MKYLSLDGVKYLWSKIKSIFLKKSDALTYEEIQASTDLTGKVATAESINVLSSISKGKGTLVSTYIKEGLCEWFKIGKIVIIRIDDVVFKEKNSNTTGIMFTGVPQVKKGYEITFMLNGSGANGTNAENSVRARASANNIQVWYSSLTGSTKYFSGNIVYIAD